MKLYLGTWQTTPSDGFWTDQDLLKSEKVLSCAVKLGILGFDCAQSYGHGQAEQTLGKVLRRYPDKAFAVDTKIMPTTKEPEELVRQSLRRLGLPIDCLYLHWPRSGFDNLLFLEKMLKLKDKGLVGRIGVCNLPPETLESYISKGLAVDRIQRPLSLLWSAGFEEEASFCREHGIEISVYSPTGMGLLSGKYRTATDTGDARGELFCFKPSCHRQYLDLVDLVSSIAVEKGVSNTKVALSWTKSREADIVLMGARDTKQLEEDLESDVRFSETELSDLALASSRLSEAAASVCSNIFSYSGERV